MLVRAPLVTNKKVEHHRQDNSGADTIENPHPLARSGPVADLLLPVVNKIQTSKATTGMMRNNRPCCLSIHWNVIAAATAYRLALDLPRDFKRQFKRAFRGRRR